MGISRSELDASPVLDLVVSFEILNIVFCLWKLNLVLGLVYEALVVLRGLTCFTGVKFSR